MPSPYLLRQRSSDFIISIAIFFLERGKGELWEQSRNFGLSGSTNYLEKNYWMASFLPCLLLRNKIYIFLMYLPAVPFFYIYLQIKWLSFFNPSISSILVYIKKENCIYQKYFSILNQHSGAVLSAKSIHFILIMSVYLNFFFFSLSFFLFISQCFQLFLLTSGTISHFFL